MRILYLAPNARLGGAEVALLTLMAGIKESRPDWSLHLISGDDGPLLERAAALGVTCDFLPFPPALELLGDSPVITGGSTRRKLSIALTMAVASRAVLQYALRLRKAIALREPTVVHTNGGKMHVLGSLSHGSVPLMWHMHEYLSPRPLMRRLMRLTARQCSVAIGVSDSVSADVAATCGSGLRVQTIYNGVELARFCPDGEVADLNRLSGLPAASPDRIRVGLVAAFAKWKGQRVFLEAVSLLSNNPSLQFYLIGGPVYRSAGSQYQTAQVRQMAADLGIGGRVGFPGHLENAPAAFRALDIVVHASTDPEPFGLVIAEAFACGRAVISSGLGGAAEVLGSDATGLTFRSGDARDLSQQIERLAADANLRARLGRSGREWAVQRFDSRRMIDQVCSLYESVAPVRR